jgi:hypothetical protein
MAENWYKADKPTSSCMYGPTVASVYTVWCKWNPTGKGGTARFCKGDLVRKREEEAGAVM